MKGITPIIGVIILVLIVIALAASAYTYVIGIYESPTSKTIKLSVNSEEANSVIVQNIGSETINPGDLRVTVNGETVSLIRPDTIPPREFARIRFDIPELGRDLNVKLQGPTNSIPFTVDIPQLPTGTKILNFTLPFNPTGQAFLDKYWVNDYNGGKIFTMDVSKGIMEGNCSIGNGCLMGSFNYEFSQPYGLASDGEFLWVSEFFGRAYKINASIGLANGSCTVYNGCLVGNFSVPLNLVGITWDGNYHWISGIGSNLTLINATKGIENNECTVANGCIIDSFSFGFQAFAIAWDGDYLWVSSSNDVHKANATVGLNNGTCTVNNGCIIESFPSISNHGFRPDGSFLWISVYNNQKLIKIYS